MSIRLLLGIFIKNHYLPSYFHLWVCVVPCTVRKVPDLQVGFRWRLVRVAAEPGTTSRRVKALAG